jgi:hypothetical protein
MEGNRTEWTVPGARDLLEAASPRASAEPVDAALARETVGPRE